MTYMQNNLAFAGGIQELSLEEIGFVGGGDIGDDESPEAPWADALLGSKSQRERSTACSIIGNIGGGILGLIAGTAATPLSSPVGGAVAGIAMAGASSVAITNVCNGQLTVTPNPAPAPAPK